jgi:transposase
LVRKEVKEIERIKNAVRFGKRVLFIKQNEVDLYGKRVYAHIVLDPERKGRETKKKLIEILEDKRVDNKEMEFELLKTGVMILISSFDISKDDVVSFYYMRQTVEQLFGLCKDDLNLLPLRVHKEQTLRGYLFFIFITLIVFMLLKKALGKGYTVEEAMMQMRNLKCKVYDKDVLISELSKQQREITEFLDIIVPKIMGI